MFFPPMRSSKLTSRITCPLRRDVRYSSRREDLPHFGVESSVDAALAREPQHATLIEHSGVQVRAFAPGRQRIDADFLGHGIDAHDGVQTAVRNPGRAV